MTPNLEKRTEMGNLIDAPEHTLTAIDEGIPLSHLIRRRLESAGARFHANDNIAAHLRDGELDALQNEVTQGMEAVLRSLVIDVDNDHNTRETARRVAKMFIREVFAGRYDAAPSVTEFPNVERLDELLIVGPLRVRSACSHHLCPIMGRIWIGVLPSAASNLIGLSKYGRLVNWVMTRPDPGRSGQADCRPPRIAPLARWACRRTRGRALLHWRGTRTTRQNDQQRDAREISRGRIASPRVSRLVVRKECVKRATGIRDECAGTVPGPEPRPLVTACATAGRAKPYGVPDERFARFTPPVFRPGAIDDAAFRQAATPGASRGRSCPGRTEFTADAAVQPDEAPDPHAELDSLLSRVAAGDEHAFAQLYRLTAARLYGAIVRMIRDRHEAEDLLQDVFTTAWRRADSFDARRGTAMTWLMTLARNRTIDRIRQHRELPLDDELALSIPDETRRPISVRRQARSACVWSAPRIWASGRRMCCGKRFMAARPMRSWPNACRCRSAR